MKVKVIRYFPLLGDTMGETEKGIDNAQLARLEKESERFADEIMQRESENKRLHQEIHNIEAQIKAGQSKLEEIQQVRKTSTFITTHRLLHTIEYKSCQSIALHFREASPLLTKRQR